MVFLAVVHSLGQLPDREMQETALFDTLPAELTYPHASPCLFTEAEKLLKALDVVKALSVKMRLLRPHKPRCR